MSIKTITQVFILFLIIFILGVVYKKYFDQKNNIVEEIGLKENKNLEQIQKLELKISELEQKNILLNNKLEKNINDLKKIPITDDKNEPSVKKSSENTENQLNNNKENESVELNKDETLIKKNINNLVKDVEYVSVDQKGNKFYLLATSGKSNEKNNDILDLENVRGKITSDKRDTIFIVSDFGKYNSVSLNSKFYENVVIDYQDKKITCINFDINMETNKAIAYNDVLITDPKSIMKAGIVEFDLKTKDINIKPQNTNTDIKVVTN